MMEWGQMVLLAELLMEQQEHKQKQDPLARMVGMIYCPIPSQSTDCSR
jgi:hypothetical protein